MKPTSNEKIIFFNIHVQVFASLASNDEDIRKKIIESENLIHHIVNALDDSSTKVNLAAIRCLHSLSRSVQQLRTTFHVIQFKLFFFLCLKFRLSLITLN